MPVVNGKHFSYTAKGRAAAKRAQARESETSTVKVPKFKRRQRIRENARGKGDLALSAKAKGDSFRAKVLARVLQNRSLKRENPNWRKEAGGGKGLFKELREAKANLPSDPKGATNVARLEAQAKNFKANRREMLPKSVKFTGGKRRKKPRTPSGNTDTDD